MPTLLDLVEFSRRNLKLSKPEFEDYFARFLVMYQLIPRFSKQLEYKLDLLDLPIPDEEIVTELSSEQNT